MAEWRTAMAQNPYLNVFQWLQHLKADNKQGNITAEECDDILRKLSLTAYESPYKVLILWMPEYLAKEGNRLLKIIEEPPDNTVFLLVAENADLILNTILSRTQLLRVPRLTDEEVMTALQTRQGISPDHARQVAALAEGNFNEALSLLTNADSDNQALLLQWLRATLGKQVVEMNVWVERMAELGREKQKNFIRYALYFLRQCIWLHTIPKHQPALSADEINLARQLIEGGTLEQFEQSYALFNQAFYHIERNANPRILFFNLSVQWMEHWQPVVATR